MKEKLWNLIWFNAAWFVCVLTAAAGQPLTGPLLMAALLVVHIARTSRPIPETVVLLSAGAVGTVLDTAVHAVGVLGFTTTTTFPGSSPLWMTTLWMGFASMLALSLDWLRGRYLLGALFGAIGGPIAYGSGARLGALQLEGTVGVLCVAAEYALAMPLLLWIDARIRGAFANPAPAGGRMRPSLAAGLRRLASVLMIITALFGLMTCASYPPMPTVAKVDLERFMGDWFVVGHIPASAEAEAYNAVESYELRDDGRIQTTYRFRDGGFDGALETMQPVGAVEDETTNATWGMQFIWPFWAEYLVVWLADDYNATIIGRSKRDYAWLMTRSPQIDEARWETMREKLVALGYDVSKLRRVPHRWPDATHPGNAAAMR